jgi:WD40 repeat protein
MHQQSVSDFGLRHAWQIATLAFSPDSKRIVTGGDGHHVVVWDVTTRQQLYELKGRSDVVSSVAFSPDGNGIASGSVDKTVRVWDSHTGQELLLFEGSASPVKCVVFGPRGRRIAAGETGGAI